MFFWQPPSCFSQWTSYRFTVDGTSYLCAEQYFAAEKSCLFGDYRALQNIMRVSNPKLHKQYGCEVRNFDAVVWEPERENIMLVGSYAKFTQNPAMQQHLLGTGDRLLAEASPYDTIWGIGYRADHRNALCPPAWYGLNPLGTAPQIVRQCLRDRDPPPVRHQHACPPRIDSPAQSRDYIFEVDPSSEERLSACDAPTAPSG